MEGCEHTPTRLFDEHPSPEVDSGLGARRGIVGCTYCGALGLRYEGAVDWQFFPDDTAAFRQDAKDWNENVADERG